MKPTPVDTKTRFQSVYARHQLHCALGVGGKRCNCDPSYFGVAWDREAGRHRKTKHRPRAVEARNLRADLLAAISEGTITERSGLTVAEAHKRFVEAMRDGIAFNKKGRPYKPNAIVDIDSSLKRLPDSVRNCPFEELRRGQLQRAVDDYRAELSGSRIRSIVNAVRSLYRWGQYRELVDHDPATLIRLPAYDSTPRDRVATPGEFAKLLAALETQDKFPFALAAYGSARSQEVRHLEWPEVDFKQSVLLLADDDAARKSESARRIVPMVRPLVKILREEWLRQGRPKTGRVCLPRRESKSGMLALGTLQKRVFEVWGRPTWNRSACKSPAIPLPPGSITLASAPRSPPSSWATRPPRPRPAPPRSRSAATPTSSPASSSAPATSSTPSSPSVKPRKRSRRGRRPVEPSWLAPDDWRREPSAELERRWRTGDRRRQAPSRPFKMDAKPASEWQPRGFSAGVSFPRTFPRAKIRL
jgi:integrase